MKFEKTDLKSTSSFIKTTAGLKLKRYFVICGCYCTIFPAMNAILYELHTFSQSFRKTPPSNERPLITAALQKTFPTENNDYFIRVLWFSSANSFKIEGKNENCLQKEEIRSLRTNESFPIHSFIIIIYS